MAAKPASYGALSEQNRHNVQIEDVSSTGPKTTAEESNEEVAPLLSRDDVEGSSLHVAQTATIPSEIANITKNLIGGGVLSLSQGIALFANSPRAFIYALCWIVTLGFITGYFCLT